MKLIETLLDATMACMVAFLLICQIGCIANPKYTEGSSLQVGAYLPGESQLYGVEILNWLNGCKVSSSTNQPFNLTREYCASNTYFWGAV